MKITPLELVGPHCTHTVYMSYDKICEVIGFSLNATHLDDEDKVEASWGLQSDDGRRAFIWCYKYYGNPTLCTQWSAYDSEGLLKDLGLIY